MRSFISATDISRRLCETRDAQELLPHLVDKLITASINREYIKVSRIQNYDLNKIAGLEWAWFNVLEDGKRGPKVLKQQITSSPELFVELIKNAFVAEGESKDNVSEDKMRVARQAYNVIKDIHSVPGVSMSSGSIAVDYGFLESWVLKVRELAGIAKRLKVCDVVIGEILSFSPESPDGSWPCVEVRNIIEKLQSPELESGINTGKSNQRGIICRDKGGSQERTLAANYLERANQIRSRWPRTAAILDRLAMDYEAEARYWDEEDKKREFE